MAFNVQNITKSDSGAWMVDTRHAMLMTAMIWTLVVLMIVPEGFDYASLQADVDPSAGSPVTRMIWLTLLALGIFFTFWRGGLAWLLLRCLNPYFLAFILLAIASVAWSIEPSLTVRRLIRLATFAFVCTAFVLWCWHARRFQNVLRPILTIMLFGSIIFGVIWPDLAIEPGTTAELAGAWHGLASQKNGLGALACMALIFWVHGWLARDVKPTSALFGIAVAATCLILSRSSTSLAATVVVLLLMVVLLRLPEFLRPYRSFLVSVIVATVIVYGLAILNMIPGLGALIEPIVALTGKDMTFTGRTQIWGILSDHISRRPLLGTGYAAYWTAAPGIGNDSYEFLVRMAGFYPGSGHNGYMDVINDLGWIGLICLLAYIVTYIRQALQLLAIDINQSTLYLALFFQQAITNLSESHWFNVLSVDFVIMTYATLSLARSLLDQRLNKVFGAPTLSAVSVESVPADRTINTIEPVHPRRMLTR